MDLNKLGLTEESAPEVDWDAPEGGKTQPSVYPGTYTLLFRLPEDPEGWFDAVERNVIKDNPASKKKFLELTYTPDVIADSQGRPISADGGEALKLGPQRVNTFMSPKMRINQMAELIRAMGVRLEGNFMALQANGKTLIENAVAELDGKATFIAEVIWRAYFKSTDVTISTHPRGKKSGELMWPRKADGTPELMAAEPTTGEKAYGYAEVARVHMPTSATEGQGLATPAA